MKKLILALTLSCFAIGNAFAQTSFESIDVDQSGGITLAEAGAAGLPWTKQQFEAADQNADGALDIDEYAAATQ
jgi:hypothetical protein